MSTLTVPRYFTEPVIISNTSELFMLFGKLIQPLREFEDVANRAEQAKADLARAKETVSTAWAMPIASGFAGAWFLAIPFTVIFLIVCNFVGNDEGVKWITLFINWVDHLPFIEWLGNILQNLIEWNFLFGGILYTIITLFVLFVAAPAVIFLFPACFVAGIFIAIFSVISAKRTIKEKTREIPPLEEELQVRLDDLVYALVFVPPDYRYSYAMEYFYRAYINGKATTLQEVINAYDTHVHQQKMEQGQQEMLSAQNAILQGIAYQSAEISKLQRSVDYLQGSVNSLHSRLTWRL